MIEGVLTRKTEQQPPGDDLREFIDAVWLCLEEKQFANWIGRKINEYVNECGADGGTPDGFWDWLDKAEACRVRGKLLWDQADYLGERIEFVRSCSSNETSPSPRFWPRARGVSPDRAHAEYDRRRADGTLPLTAETLNKKTS